METRNPKRTTRGVRVTELLGEDAENDEFGSSRTEFIDFIYSHFLQKYGLRKLAERHLVKFISAVASNAKGRYESAALFSSAASSHAWSVMIVFVFLSRLLPAFYTARNNCFRVLNAHGKKE